MARLSPFVLLLLAGCSTAGSTWMAQPLTPNDDDPGDVQGLSAAKSKPGPKVRGGSFATQTLTDDPAENGAKTLSDEPLHVVRHLGGKLEGRVLGKFRNTYYDFPAETDFSGPAVALKSAECQTIKDVPRGFYDAVCVQGSGTLASGQTVSFAKRDCSCAEVCPKTGQKICFDALDPRQFPYGRGATGNPITPLWSVAVDSDVIPLGTTIYIPELDGAPRDAEASGLHDGCFIAQDRGLRVKGNHVDIFTGDATMTRLWNKLVPSNQGVTVVRDSPRCEKASTEASAPMPSSTPSEPAAPSKKEHEKSSKKKNRKAPADH